MTAGVSDRLVPGRFLRTGHRGARGLAPENTMPSFETAARLGVDLIELDVQSTADGQIVVLHDATVDRTTDGSGVVARMAWREIESLDAGYRFTPDGGRTFPHRGLGVRIPKLEDVFQVFPDVGFTVEIKSSPHPEFHSNLSAVIQKFGRSRVILAAERHEDLVQMRKLAPEVPTNLSRSEVRRFYFMEKLGLAFLFRSPGRVFQVPVYAGGDDRTGLRVVTRGFIRAAHKSGRAVQVWTVNDPTEIRELLDLGVDGITTDRPDVLNEVLGHSE